MANNKATVNHMDAVRGPGRPKSMDNLEKHTYALPKYLVKALKRKAVEEDKTVVETLKKILKNGIEDKYFESR